MEGGSEHVVGSATGMVTDHMNVPNWKELAFVTNEIWDVFSETPLTWIETGNITGYGNSENVIEPFWATKPCGTCNFLITINSLVAIGRENQTNYGLREDKAHHGDWEVLRGGALIGSFEPEPEYANTLEGGAEASDSVEPYNGGFDTVSAIEPPNWTEHTWAGKNHKAVYEHDPAMCGEPWGSIGDAIFGTCSGFPLAPVSGGSPVTVSQTPKATAHAVALSAGDASATITREATGSLSALTSTIAPHARLGNESAGEASASYTLITMHGSFTLPAPVPKGAPDPTGSELAVIVDGTGAIRSIAVGNESVGS